MPIFTIFANIAAPTIVTRTGNIFAVLSIIPLECLVLWLLFHYFFKIKIGIPRLLITVIVANIITSIIGVPFAFNNSFANSAGSAIMILPLLFAFTWFIEGIIYLPLLKSKNNKPSKGKLRIASLLANLASYTLFLFVLLPVSSKVDSFTQLNPKRAEREVKMALFSTLGYQKEFYANNSQFAKNFEELPGSPQPYVPDKSFVPTENKLENKFHKFAVNSDSEKATITATAKVDYLNSYTGIIFVVKDGEKSEFITGICKTDQPSTIPPQSVQLKDEQINCPSGSSFLVASPF